MIVQVRIFLQLAWGLVWLPKLPFLPIAVWLIGSKGLSSSRYSSAVWL